MKGLCKNMNINLIFTPSCNKNYRDRFNFDTMTHRKGWKMGVLFKISFLFV